MLFYFMFYKMFYQSNYIITIQTRFVNMFFHIFIYFIISKHIFCIFFTISTQKNGKKTVVTVFFPFFTIISFFNFTQLLVFHTYKADIRIRFATCQWELYRTEFSVQKIPTCEQLLQFYHMFCEKVFRGSNS